MKPENNCFFKYTVLFLFMIVCFSACTRVPVKVPVEKETGRRQPSESQIEKQKAEQPEISIINILSEEAEKFSRQGNFQDALFVYNQAFSQATEDEKPGLITRIESVLIKTPAAIIEEFSEIKNIQIPRALLLYWMGLNYALENNRVKSRDILETFLTQYPDHPYYSDAADLVAEIKKSLFKKDTIGCLLPLTGKYAVFGQRALSGIQLAIQELSEKYAGEFNTIIIDTQANPAKAIEGVKILSEKRVAGIIGPLLAVNEAGQEAETLKMPMIALTQKSEFPSQGDYLFSNFITPEMQVQTLGRYLFQDLGLKKVAILYPDEKYGKKYMSLFWDVVDAYDGEVVGVEPYDGSKTDFSEPIQKLTGEFFPLPDFLKPEKVEPETVAPKENTVIPTDPDMAIEMAENKSEAPAGENEEKIRIDFQALFIPDSPSTVNLILPQLVFNDAKGMYLVGTNLWHHDSLLQGAKGYNKQAIITDGFFDNSQNPVSARFTKNFETLFGNKPKFLEAISYDTASILFVTAMDEQIDSRDALKESLQSGRVFQGVTGNTQFDRNGSAHRDLFLMTIKNGKFVEISR